VGLKGRIERLETILEAKQRALSRERGVEQTAQRSQRRTLCATRTLGSRSIPKRTTSTGVNAGLAPRLCQQLAHVCYCGGVVE